MRHLLIYLYCLLLLPMASLARHGGASIDSLMSAMSDASEEDLPTLLHKLHYNLQHTLLSPSDAAEIVQASVAICQQNNAEEAIIRFASFGNIQYQTSLYSHSSSLSQLKDSLEHYYHYFKQQQFDAGIASTSKWLAFHYKNMGILDKSLKYALEATDIYERLQYKQDAILLYSQIADEHYLADNISFAYFYIQKALVAGVLEHSGALKTKTLNTLGLIYQKQNKYDSAKYYFQYAIKTAEAQQDSMGVGIAKGHLGSIYVSLHQYDTALTYLEENIYYSKKYNKWSSAISSLNDLGLIYEKRQQWTEALAVYNDAYEITKASPSAKLPKAMYNTLNNLSRVYAALDQTRQAFRFSQKAKAWGDSIISQNLNASVARIQQQYEWERQTQVIKAHEAAQMRELEAEHSKNISLLVIALSLGVLFLTAIYINRQQQQLNRELTDRNQEIHTKNRRIESQNEELAQQQEEITMQHKKLIQANNQLQKSNTTLKEEEKFLKDLLTELAEGSEQIEMHNQQLTEQIQSRTRELLVKSEELARYTQQLEGFAYVTAHNIRGPIARIKGLTNIFDQQQLTPENAYMWELITHSVDEVDEIIKDLSSMLEVRTNIHESFTEVSLNAVVEKTKKLLEVPISESRTTISVDFQENTLYTIKPYIESIIYQLISNSIKFRKYEVAPKVQVKTIKDGGNIILTVEDNGLGLDTEKHQEHLFQMYKRFHLHTKGKGLGLHLVKVQTENLHGHIELQSKPNQGMKVIVTLPIDPGIVVH